MKILDFIKSLVPRIDKEQVLEDINITKTELTTGVLPMYQTARTSFKTMKFKSKEVKELEKVFLRNYSPSSKNKQENIIGDITEALPLILANLTYVESQAEELFARDILKEGLSSRKVMLIRAADHIFFITKFAVDLLNVVYVYEAESRNTNIDEDYKGPKRNRDIVSTNIYIFGKLLQLYAIKEKDFKALIDKMPDVIINTDTEDVVKSVYKEHDLDPMAAKLSMNFDSNPIYHIRLVVAEWQANRYKRFLDKKKMLELRLLHLKMLEEQQHSDSLEREIKYIQGRIDTLDYKIAKMES